jgi:hypothetical protein
VSAYIEETKNRRSVSFNIYVVDAPSCKSLGAAMRDVDARGKIRGDFFLIHGDVIRYGAKNLLPALVFGICFLCLGLPDIWCIQGYEILLFLFVDIKIPWQHDQAFRGA